MEMEDGIDRDIKEESRMEQRRGRLDIAGEKKRLLKRKLELQKEEQRQMEEARKMKAQEEDCKKGVVELYILEEEQSRTYCMGVVRRSGVRSPGYVQSQTNDEVTMMR
jgi:hypothetical protein